jgi:hypothetical protein
MAISFATFLLARGAYSVLFRLGDIVVYCLIISWRQLYFDSAVHLVQPTLKDFRLKGFIGQCDGAYEVD